MAIIEKQAVETMEGSERRARIKLEHAMLTRVQRRRDIESESGSNIRRDQALVDDLFELFSEYDRSLRIARAAEDTGVAPREPLGEASYLFPNVSSAVAGKPAEVRLEGCRPLASFPPGVEVLGMVEHLNGVYVATYEGVYRALGGEMQGWWLEPVPVR
jgi:hypothetical protein